MCMFIRRKKIVCIALLTVVMMTSLQHWTDTKATWKNTVLMKLRQYQIELRQSIDFSNFELRGNTTNANSQVSDDRTPFRMNELLKCTKKCLQRSRNKLTQYLSRTFEEEFASDHKIEKIDNPILEPACPSNIDLIIMLTTRPGAFYSRAAIRSSWGRMDSDINKLILGSGKDSFKYRTIFIVGRDHNSKIEKLLEDEHKYYEDILRLNYRDKYENLTNKTVLSLEWFANNCQPNYILKTDDDCFVNLLSIKSWIKTLSPTTKYIGKKNDLMPVIRDPDHRNYVPKNEYGEEYYKPYCSGGGYMIAGDVLKNLTRKAKNINQIINEDAYIGMVMHALNITPIDDPRFLPFVFTKKGVNKRQMCDWRDNFLMHGVEPEKQISMHWTRLAMTDYPSICESNLQSSTT